LVLLRGGGRVVVVDGVVGVADGVVGLGGVDDVSVSVVSELNEVVGARGHAAVDVLHPGGVGSEVRRPQAEALALGVVHVGVEVNVIDLGAEVCLAGTEEETTSHPVDVGVLEEVGGRAPFGGPRAEPNHLLTTSEVVDDGSGGVGVEDTAGSVLGHLPSGSGVDDLGRVVVHVLGAHGGISLDVGRLETGAVGEGDQLFDVVAAASNTLVGRGCAESRLRVSIDADEANTKGELVGVDGVVLVVADTAVPDATIVLVGELAEGDDAAVVTLRLGRVESR